MTRYYFLGAVLPELELGQPLPLSIEDLIELLKDNLSSTDYRKVGIVRRFYDLENLRSIWRGSGPFDRRGEFIEADLQEALQNDDELPAYVREFLLEHKSAESCLKNFSFLLAAYYQNATACTSGALKVWLQFDRELWLIQAAYRANKMDREFLDELPYLDHEEKFVRQLLAFKDEGGANLPQSIEEIMSIFDAHYDAPLQLHQALCRYRFDKVKGLMCKKIFSFDRILGTMIQLFIMQNYKI